MVKTQHKPKSRPSGTHPPAFVSGPASDTRLKILICLALAVLTLIAYWQVFGCKFIDRWDDQEYVTNNPFIMKGLGPGSLAWAFTTYHCGNWHPITWLTHMLDYQLYGLSPFGHHLTNLLFHIANALLLFLALAGMTRSVWRSAFVAALFAVHPIHVESVAWIAERKDVLSIFFWLLTMHAYVRYTRRPGLSRYLLLVVPFALGLMSKPTLVSLPIVLLLLDYWPLDRMNLKWRLLWEKLPLLAMSAASCAMTFIAQRAGGAVMSLGDYSFAYRAGNAAISYMAYIAKMLWPANLAIFYPLIDKDLPIWQALGSALILAIVTVVLLIRNGRRPGYLIVGWLWYLITLVPMVGLVQVGLQAMADRYSYITLTGLFVIIAWGVPDLLARRVQAANRYIPAVAVALVLALAACTWSQVGFWHDSFTVFDHAIKVTRDNAYAYRLRGAALDAVGRREEALRDFQTAVDLQPNFAYAHTSLGGELVTLGKVEEGMRHLQAALRLGYDNALVRNNLAVGYLRLRKVSAAEEQCRIALRLDPQFADANNVMAVILTQQGKVDQSISHLKEAAALAPRYADPHINLAMAYYFKRDYASAWTEVHVYEQKGGTPDPDFLADLSNKMPDPGD